MSSKKESKKGSKSNSKNTKPVWAQQPIKSRDDPFFDDFEHEITLPPEKMTLNIESSASD